MTKKAERTDYWHLIDGIGGGIGIVKGHLRDIEFDLLGYENGKTFVAAIRKKNVEILQLLLDYLEERIKNLSTEDQRKQREKLAQIVEDSFDLEYLDTKITDTISAFIKRKLVSESESCEDSDSQELSDIEEKSAADSSTIPVAPTELQLTQSLISQNQNREGARISDYGFPQYGVSFIDSTSISGTTGSFNSALYNGTKSLYPQSNPIYPHPTQKSLLLSDLKYQLPDHKQKEKQSNSMQETIKNLKTLPSSQENNSKDGIRNAVLLESLGHLYIQCGKYEEARRTWDKALSLVEEVAAQNLKFYPPKENLLNNIGNAYQELEDTSKALEYYQRALNTANIEIEKEIIIRNGIANVYSKQQYFDKAIKEYEDIVKKLSDNITSRFGNDKHISVVVAINNLAASYLQNGERSKAKEQLIKAQEILEALFSKKDNPLYVALFNNLGQLHSQSGDSLAALDAYKKAKNIVENTLGQNNVMMLICLTNISEEYIKKGDHPKALKNQEEAQEIAVKIFGDSHPIVASCFNNYANTLMKQQKFDNAIKYHEKAIKIRKEFNITGFDLAVSYNNLGNVYAMRKEPGDLELALSQHSEAEKIVNALSISNRFFGIIYKNLANDHLIMDNFDKGFNFWRKSLEVEQKFLPRNEPSLVQDILAYVLAFCKNKYKTFDQLENLDQKTMKLYFEDNQLNLLYQIFDNITSSDAPEFLGQLISELHKKENLEKLDNEDNEDIEIDLNDVLNLENLQLPLGELGILEGTGDLNLTGQTAEEND